MNQKYQLDWDAPLNKALGSGLHLAGLLEEPRYFLELDSATFVVEMVEAIVATGWRSFVTVVLPLLPKPAQEKLLGHLWGLLDTGPPESTA